MTCCYILPNHDFDSFRTRKINFNQSVNQFDSYDYNQLRNGLIILPNLRYNERFASFFSLTKFHIFISWAIEKICGGGTAHKGELDKNVIFELLHIQSSLE